MAERLGLSTHLSATRSPRVSVAEAEGVAQRCEKRLAGPAVPDHNRGEALGGSAVVRAGTAALEGRRILHQSHTRRCCSAATSIETLFRPSGRWNSRCSSTPNNDGSLAYDPPGATTTDLARAENCRDATRSVGISR